ncbi:MAG: cytochrome b N-terminal domain-containing protein [Anaerolineae bacterium]|nr:cytochrome b N-terminal domain-containing protein [Anaerolineae bacterium]
MAAQPEGQSNTGFWRVLDERLGLSGLAYPVPEHANTLPYFLGGITLAGFVILVATGVLLAQFYHPHPANAHDSVIYIVTEAPFGDFIRSLHFWAANLVVITAVLHLIRVFVSGSFKRPREVNWLVGLSLLGLTLGFVFTGTVLKWDQESVEALAHNREIGELLGSFGTWFTNEFTRSVPLLTRLYLGHVSLLPVLLILLVLFHLYLIKLHGISPKATVDATSGPPTAEKGSSRFITHLRRLIGYGFLLLSVDGALALLLPAPLGQAGVPGAEVTKPPWMFLPLYPLEDVLGIRGLLLGSIVLFGLLALVPFVDRSRWLSPRRRRWIIIAGGILLVLLIILAVFAWLSRPAAHLME